LISRYLLLLKRVQVAQYHPYMVSFLRSNPRLVYMYGCKLKIISITRLQTISACHYVTFVIESAYICYSIFKDGRIIYT
ncbi:MAG TPA: hypothetical protein PLR36_04690, partial [Ferruginibacter sp.]|nr:hypothetical protein [Ferruginibacter sp.]